MNQNEKREVGPSYFSFIGLRYKHQKLNTQRRKQQPQKRECSRKVSNGERLVDCVLFSDKLSFGVVACFFWYLVLVLLSQM